MARLRTRLALPVAAAAALLTLSQPAAAAPVTAGSAAKTTAATRIAPSQILDLYLQGPCTTPLKAVIAMQRIDWMWAPLALDNGDGSPLAKILVPYTMLLPEQGWRGRHDMVPGQLYTAPGPKPASLTSCSFTVTTPEGTASLVVTGTVVTIPKWLDDLTGPVLPPR